MTSSLFHLPTLNLDQDDISLILNYYGSVIQKLVKDQMFVDRDVNILNISVLFDMNRRVSQQKDLNLLFLESFKEGRITPISTLQLLHLKSLVDDDLGYDINLWREYSFWSALSVGSMDESMKEIFPQLDENSKFQLSNVAKNPEYLKTSYYLPDTCLEWQNTMCYEINLNDWVTEILIRSMLANDYPSCVPVHSRGDWVGVNASSPNINSPSYHRLSKFHHNDLDEALSRLVIDLGMKDVKKPIYIKRQTRCCRDLPTIFHKIVY